MSSHQSKMRVENLKKHFTANQGLLDRLLSRGDREVVKAVDGVNFDIREGESFGLAGESGCGKSTLGKTLLNLHDSTDGSIYFDDADITTQTGREDIAFRTEAQLIQQDPFNSINPRYKVFDWVKEPLDVHSLGTRDERTDLVMETLNEVGLRPAEAYASEYPTELSGGERQRVGIARALVLNPSFLVADEPVSMLDVSVRASVLELLNRLKEERGLTTLFISHDLSLLKHMCDRIAIMYLGQIVEVGPARQLINDPQHPYTEALVSSTPIIDPDVERERIRLEGEVPDPINLPSGCRFAPRCPKVMDECWDEEPRMYDVAEEQEARCILHDEAHADKDVSVGGAQATSD
ncbi:ATP-binding cassette domain-containing protein [Halorubrum sp. CBA1125]|uniref:ABC transporter ATP-binding protein n=1 Tax=Halorubrum sp. CBA1125 TaxID=2668072 RepID=UPI0012E860A2|nr:ABC transporter ATP-binding protein [Halorubrum sp. CBA1125]MUW13394.1 ATP-binding cassette domain-containing protein [Halorubrum sp. CBA1125]